MNRRLLLFLVIAIILAGGSLVYYGKFGGETANDQPQNGNISTSGSSCELNVTETDGVKHGVPLDEIVGGGPEKDGIPSIDDPKFVSPAEADQWLDGNSSGLAVDMGGKERFYPFQILVYHEIVNDIIDGKRILVSFCPLCQSGIVFDPLVQGERVEFGTSGKLWNSNLVMYDRRTNSLWSQALGKAIVGEETGSVLEILPFDQLKYADWKTAHPEGEVLSRDTGAEKFYGADPYDDYYTTSEVYYPVNNQDDRLEQKDLILGLEINGQAKAYLPSAVKEAGAQLDELGGTSLSVEYLEEIDSVRIYKINEDGSKERINPFPMFWFAWVAIHPETELFK